VTFGSGGYLCQNACNNWFAVGGMLSLNLRHGYIQERLSEFWKLVHWWGSAVSGPSFRALGVCGGHGGKICFFFIFLISYVDSEGFGSESPV
jgi:hypothetical protein